VVLPIGAALTCVVAGLAMAGIGLTILHLVGLLLTVAVGSNYTLFFIDNDDDNPRLLASLALANATTIIGFGILAFASVPVLNAIGMTVGPGALLCLAFAAMISAPNRVRQ
jgi:predicted exporter